MSARYRSAVKFEGESNQLDSDATQRARVEADL